MQALKSEIGVQKFNEVYQKLPKPVKEQLNYIKEPKLIAEPLYLSITKKVNNIYLQANAQSNGIESYVNMVNYLLSYYADTINPDGII